MPWYNASPYIYVKRMPTIQVTMGLYYNKIRRTLCKGSALWNFQVPTFNDASAHNFHDALPSCHSHISYIVTPPHQTWREGIIVYDHTSHPSNIET